MKASLLVIRRGESSANVLRLMGMTLMDISRQLSAVDGSGLEEERRGSLQECGLD